MLAALKRLFRAERPQTNGVGLCTALLREGWKCHRFADCDIIVALPHDFLAAFDSEGVLIGTIDGSSHNFSATLHRNEAFTADPKSAYRFVDHLAQKSGATPLDKGTYRFFRDPNVTGDDQLHYTFYVIGIPGAVVVVSIASTPHQERPQALKQIEAAVPDLIGEIA
jgi:hypothetical protein